jgi:hypothetical protein
MAPEHILAGFGARVESARGKFSIRKEPGSGGAGKQLGMLGGISARPHSIIARLDDDRPSGVDNERAERMTPVGTGFAGQFNGAAKEGFVNRGKRRR